MIWYLLRFWFIDAIAIIDLFALCSLAGVAQRVDDHDEDLENVTNDLAETKETVQRVDGEVAKQGADINNLSNQVEEQKEEVKVMKAELAEAIIEIDRIDRKVRSNYVFFICLLVLFTSKYLLNE